jgi:hypothetical protein
MRNTGLTQSAIDKHEDFFRFALWQRGFVDFKPSEHRFSVKCLIYVGLLAMIAPASQQVRAQSSATTTKDAAAALLSTPPRSWAVDAAANELVALYHRDSYLRYRMHIVNEKGDQVRDIVENKDGTVARLILRNGKPLTDDEDKAERQRLADMLAAPAAFAKHVKNSESDRKLANKLIPLIPDASIFSYTPGQPQASNWNGLQVVLDFKPNPKFSPPSTEAEALTGLEGRVWIDAKSHHLIRMEGTVSRAVNFGWGMIAHIFPGGKLVLEQTDAGGGRWIFTHFSMTLSVRALMVKTLNIRSNTDASAFQILAPMSYQDAIHLLLGTPLPQR